MFEWSAVTFHISNFSSNPQLVVNTLVGLVHYHNYKFPIFIEKRSCHQLTATGGSITRLAPGLMNFEKMADVIVGVT